MTRNQDNNDYAPEKAPHNYHRRAADTNLWLQVKDTMLQYKAIGVICLVMMAGIYIVYGDVKESTRGQLDMMKENNAQMRDIVSNNARLVEKTATALDNNTKALNNNSQVMQEFGARVDKVEGTVKDLGHRITNVEGAVRGKKSQEEN
jgi:methyl-accepting chemotaxis protein